MFFIFLFVFCVFKEEFNFWLHLKKKIKAGEHAKTIIIHLDAIL